MAGGNNKYKELFEHSDVSIITPVSKARFLDGDFGKTFLEEYNERVKKDYNDSDKLKVLKYDNGLVRGSNPFAVVLANAILNQEGLGLRTANQADLEKILRAKALTLDGQYEDSGLCLRSEGNPNEYLAKHLMKQLKARGRVKLPVMLNLTDLELINDSDSNYGLSFKLREDAKPIYAPQLDNKNDGKSFSQTDENGLPVFNKDGNRTLYTRDGGLSGVLLGYGFGLYAWDGDLACSDAGGRVVSVNDN